MNDTKPPLMYSTRIQIQMTPEERETTRLYKRKNHSINIVYLAGAVVIALGTYYGLIKNNDPPSSNKPSKLEQYARE